MNDRLFMSGVGCAVGGFILSIVVAYHGHEPRWAVPILFALLLGWVGFTVAAFIFKNH
jgi:hypothetical protein